MDTKYVPKKRGRKPKPKPPKPDVVVVAKPTFKIIYGTFIVDFNS